MNAEDVILEVSHLEKSFGSHDVLRDISFQVAKGDVVSVIGASGSGKSTMLRCVNLLETPTGGSILYHGEDITDPKINVPAYRSKVGMVFQSFNLLPKLTALENVALPLLYGGVKKAERLERARAALETVGLSDRVDHRPDQLSGGQCQRVAIARAIVGKPKLLLADEPTGALDSASGAAVMELFQQLHDGGSTIIMITHDHSIANHAAKVMTIRDGVLSGGDDYE
mgnify:CR=1 FL=1